MSTTTEKLLTAGYSMLQPLELMTELSKSMSKLHRSDIKIALYDALTPDILENYVIMPKTMQSCLKTML